MPPPKSPTSGLPAAEIASARASRLVDVSNQIANMLNSLRESRAAVLARHGEPCLTPPPVPGMPHQDPGRDALDRLRADLAASREAEAEMRARLDEIEEAQRTVGDELVALQVQMAHTAWLAVVLRRLHEATSPTDLLDGVQEVVINVLGCEDFVLLGLDGGSRATVARHMGRSAAEAEALAAQGAVAAAAAAGRILDGADAAALVPGLTLLVPLVARGRVSGAAALFQLLPQKGQLGPLDAEVAELLSVHGGLAWLAMPGTADGR